MEITTNKDRRMYNKNRVSELKHLEGETMKIKCSCGTIMHKTGNKFSCSNCQNEVTIVNQ